MTIDRLSHVVVGGGHFVNHGGQLIQQCAQHQARIQAVINRLTALNEFGVPSHIPVGDRPNLSLQNRPDIVLIANDNNDSSAWQGFQDFWADFTEDPAFEMAKEAILMAGSAAAGDLEGTVEHGAKAVELYFESRGTMPMFPDRDK